MSAMRLDFGHGLAGGFWRAAVAGLCVALSAAWGSAAAPAGKAEPGPAKAAAAAAAPNTPTGQARSQPSAKLRLRPDNDKPIPHLPEGSSAGVMGKMLAYVVVILALGGLAVVVVKRFLPRISPPAAGVAQQKIRVAATTYLGPRKQLHILEVGGQRFLVASCRDNVSMIAELGGSFERVYQKEIASPPGGATSVEGPDGPEP